MKKYVCYYRVSTQKQGAEGLGILGQKNAVERFIGNSQADILGEFIEVETGTRKRKRVEIYKAIDLAKKHGATLLVAKLDRLARNVEFTSALYNAGLDFVCCDNPTANKLTIQLLSVIAEHEAEVISNRIKSALAVKKERIKNGIITNKDGSEMKPINGKYRLGNPNGIGDKQKLGVQKIKELAATNKANIQAMDIICSARKQNLTLQQIADKLNTLQYSTRYGKQFTPTQVHRLLFKCAS
jgi:DNA invertase Pin-like site-specific DNA recombinase